MSESTRPADTSTDGGRIDMKRAAMQHAQDALFVAREFTELYDTEHAAWVNEKCHEAIAALRAALAEPPRPLPPGPVPVVPQPVEWNFSSFDDWWDQHGFFNAVAADQVNSKPLAKLAWDVSREMALRAALAEQNDDLTAAWMAGAAEERKRAEQAQPVAVVTECEACFTPDVCRLRGTCDHYAAEKLRITAPPAPQPLAEQAEPLQEHSECPACGEKEAKLYALFRCQECQGEYLGSAEHLKPQPLTDDDIYRITGHCGVSKHAAISIARAVEAEVLRRMGVRR